MSAYQRFYQVSQCEPSESHEEHALINTQQRGRNDVPTFFP